MSFSMPCWPFFVITIQLNVIEHLIVLNCCKIFLSLIIRPSRGQLHYWVCLPVTSELVQPRSQMGGGEGGEGLDLPFPGSFIPSSCPLLEGLYLLPKILLNLSKPFVIFQILSSSLLGPIPNLSLLQHPPSQYPNRQCYVLLASQPSLRMTSTMKKKVLSLHTVWYSTGTIFSSIIYT